MEFRLAGEEEAELREKIAMLAAIIGDERGLCTIS